MKRMVESEIADILNEKLQVDENGIDVKDNLHVNGKISGGEIVEDMEGYSYSPLVAENFTHTDKYVGAVKNGNKLTLTVLSEIQRSDTVNQGTILGQFNIPTSIANKLVPVVLSELSVVYSAELTVYQYIVTGVKIGVAITKHPTVDGRLNVMLYNLSNTVVDTKYLLRFEATFLLSDNLAA